MRDGDGASMEELLACRERVRALARRLAADESGAEDLEQETWLRAIRQPPRQRGAPFAWLAAVLRNLARDGARGDRRRVFHEHRGSRADATPSAEDVVAEAEVLRIVAHAVRALPEPYRATVIRRWYEGLAPRTIAAAEGVPVETVRTRLKRAHALLRRELDARFGPGAKGWQAAVLEGPLAVASRSEVNGGVVVAATAKGVGWISTAILVLLAGFYWAVDRNGRSEPDLRTAPEKESGALATKPVLEGRSTGQTPGGSREGQPEGALADAILVGLDVRVIDWSDRAISGAVVEAYRLGEPIEQDTLAAPQVGATTDARGRAVLHLAMDAGWVVAASCAGLSRSAVRLDHLVQTDPPVGIVLRLGPGYALAGRVLDAEAKPVPGAEVLVSIGDPSRPPQREVRGRSETDGAYSLDRLPGGDIDLFVRRIGGTLRPAGRVRLPFSGAHDIRLPDGARLMGHVLGPDQRPVPGATIRLHPFGQGVLKTRADESGLYLFEDVGQDERWNFLAVEAPGLTVAADQRGYVLVGGDVGVCLRLDPMKPGDRREQDVLLVRAASIEGRVLGPKGPLPGARVEVLIGIDELGYTDFKTTANDSGRYAFESLPAGRAFLDASDGSHVLADVPVFNRMYRAREGGEDAASVVVAAGERAVLDLRLVDSVGVTGRVLTAQDSPVAGASVWVGPHVPEGHTPRTVSSADGRFRVEGLVPGVPTHAWASRDGYALAGASAFTPGAEGDVVVRMQASRRIRGRVRAPDGPAPAGARVKGAAVGKGVQPVEAWARFQRALGSPVLADGSFEVEVLLLDGAVGEASVMALAPGYAPTRSAALRLAADREPPEVEIVLQRGESAVVHVTEAGSGSPLAGASLTLTTIAEDSIVEDWQAAQPDADFRGEIRLDGLVRGQHTALVSAPGHVSLWLKWGIPTPPRLEAAMLRALSIEGVVLGPDGASAVNGAVVEAEPLATSSVPVDGPAFERTTARAVTSAVGRFRLVGLAAGRYRLKATPPPRGPSLAPASLEADGGAEDLRVVLHAAGQLAGVVVGPDGTPLRDIRVRVLSDGSSRAGRDVQETATGPDGTWRVSGLTAQLFTVRVVTPLWGKGEELCGEERTGVVPGTEDSRFVLREGLTIEGVCIGSSIAPR